MRHDMRLGLIYDAVWQGDIVSLQSLFVTEDLL